MLEDSQGYVLINSRRRRQHDIQLVPPLHTRSSYPLYQFLCTTAGTRRALSPLPLNSARQMPSRKPLAVVTASTSGIGLSAALSLAKRGFHVIISSRKHANVSAAVDFINSVHGPDAASGIPCHVAKPVDRAALFAFAQQRASFIKTLVLNAAVSTAYGRIFDVSEAQWDKMFDVNVKAVFFLVKDFLHMLGEGSSVVIVASIAAYSPIPGLGAYSITKTALLGMCKVLSSELAVKGIRVNALAPGLVRTKFSEKLWRDDADADQVTEKQSSLSKFAHIPMNRIAQPDEIGGVIAFLASDDASYITGETVVVAGGIMSKL